MTPLKTFFLVAFFGLFGTPAQQPEDPDLVSLLEKVRQRVKQHYIDLQSLAWTDWVRWETLKEDRAPADKPRDFVYDVIIRLEQPKPEDTGVPFYVREQSELRSIDGKPAKKNQTPQSRDPRAANMSNFLFLLLTDSRAQNYQLSYGGPADLNGRKTWRIAVHVPQKTPPQVTWDVSFGLSGVRNNFNVTGVHYNHGMLWIDPDTYDILRLEWRSDPFEFQRRSKKFRYETQLTVNFQQMSIGSPELKLAVPVSLESLTKIRGVTRTFYRITHTFTDYKRFSGDATILKFEGEK